MDHVCLFRFCRCRSSETVRAEHDCFDKAPCVSAHLAVTTRRPRWPQPSNEMWVQLPPHRYWARALWLKRRAQWHNWAPQALSQRRQVRVLDGSAPIVVGVDVGALFDFVRVCRCVVCTAGVVFATVPVAARCKADGHTLEPGIAFSPAPPPVAIVRLKHGVGPSPSALVDERGSARVWPNEHGVPLVLTPPAARERNECRNVIGSTATACGQRHKSTTRACVGHRVARTMATRQVAELGQRCQSLMGKAVAMHCAWLHHPEARWQCEQSTGGWSPAWLTLQATLDTCIQLASCNTCIQLGSGKSNV